MSAAAAAPAFIGFPLERASADTIRIVEQFGTIRLPLHVIRFEELQGEAGS